MHRVPYITTWDVGVDLPAIRMWAARCWLRDLDVRFRESWGRRDPRRRRRRDEGWRHCSTTPVSDGVLGRRREGRHTCSAMFRQLHAVKTRPTQTNVPTRRWGALPRDKGAEYTRVKCFRLTTHSRSTALSDFPSSSSQRCFSTVFTRYMI